MTPGVALWLIPAWFASIIVAAAIGAWVERPIAFDRGFEEADGRERHRHRIGDPKVDGLPRAGRLPAEPMPATHSDWMFFAPQTEPVGPAEYELMTRTTQTMTAVVTSAAAAVKLPGDAGAAETPSAWTRRQALEMDAFIKGMREESNYFQHTVIAGGGRRAIGEGGAR